MTSHYDTANSSPAPTLFDAAPAEELPKQIARLTAELEQERKWRREMESAWREADRKLCVYRNLDAMYSLLKTVAERAAQAPIDSHYRRRSMSCTPLHLTNPHAPAMQEAGAATGTIRNAPSGSPRTRIRFLRGVIPSGELNHDQPARPIPAASGR